MDIQKMRQELINQIRSVKDEEILKSLSEELTFSIECKNDLSNILSSEDMNELTMLVNEPLYKDTMTLKEFNNIMDQWLMK